MPNIASAYAAPATAIVTTAETLTVNVPPTPLTLPGGAPQQIVIRGNVNVTTGAAATAVQVKLRTGLNNTTTGQVNQTEQIQVAAAAANEEIPFHFEDLVPADLAGGYSITVTQVAATGNGTINAVEYEVATTP